MTTGSPAQPIVTDRAPGLAGARGACRAGARRAPALAVRQRPLARRALRGRGRRPVPRLLEEPHHRRDGPSPRGSGRRVRTARAHRGDVPRRDESTRRKSARCSMSRFARRGTQSIVLDGDERRAARARGARSDGHVRRPGPGWPLARAHRPARAHRHQYRDRRLRSRSGHGLRGAEALQRARPRPSASSRTWTAPTSPRRRAISIPPRPCSSSRPRRSPRSRR